MSVDKFIESLDIFKAEEEQYVGVKATAALAISISLLIFPASALRWDGSIRSPLDRQPLTKIEQTRLYPNAIFNRTIRILSGGMGLGLALYAAMLDTKDLSNIGLKRKKREAREILEDEILNANIIKILPAEEKPVEALPPGSNLSPIAQKALAMMYGNNVDKSEENLEVLAAKFKTAPKQTVQSNEVMMKSRNVAVNEAIAHVEAPQTAPANNEPPIDKYVKFAEIGKNIINGMVITEKSILIASGTGTGKTTTEQYLLDGLIKHYPATTFYALLQKNDQLTGVREENREVFNNMALTEYINQGSAEDEEAETQRIFLQDILHPLFTVYAEFCRRKELPAVERERLKDEAPIRLILGDWFATYQELLRLSKKDFGHVMSMIRGIITVGRDSGMALIIDTQSGALASLGLAEDASIRESLDIYSQGYVRWVNGREKGEVRTMLQMINNNSMVSKEDREGITKAYLLLTNGINAGEVRAPIIFTTVGSVPGIGILPNLAHMTVRANEVVIETQKPSVQDLGIAPAVKENMQVITLQPTKTTYTRFNLSQELARQQVSALLQSGQTQTQVIKYFWDANPGANKSYETAKAQLEELIKDEE